MGASLKTNLQKQPSRGVLKKRSSEYMQEIYRRTHMPKCDFRQVKFNLILLETPGNKNKVFKIININLLSVSEKLSIFTFKENLKYKKINLNLKNHPFLSTFHYNMMPGYEKRCMVPFKRPRPLTFNIFRCSLKFTTLTITYLNCLNVNVFCN